MANYEKTNKKYFFKIKKMLDFSIIENIEKAEDYLHICKNIVGDDKCFLLKASNNSNNKYNIKTGDWLLFKVGKPKIGDIVIFGLGYRKYKLGLYTRTAKGYIGLVSLVNGEPLKITEPSESMQGILKLNIGVIGA